MSSLKVLWIGRNAIEKSPSSLFKIAEKVNNATFHVMGLSPIDKKNIISYGKVSNEKLKDLYNHCDIFLLTSVWIEPAGLVVLEAQQCGMPVVGFNWGGSVEYILLKEYLFKDVEEVVSFLNKLANDIGLLRKIKSTKMKLIEFIENNFTYQVMGKNYEDLYKKTIDNYIYHK